MALNRYILSKLLLAVNWKGIYSSVEVPIISICKATLSGGTTRSFRVQHPIPTQPRQSSQTRKPTSSPESVRRLRELLAQALGPRLRSQEPYNKPLTVCSSQLPQTWQAQVFQMLQPPGPLPCLHPQQQVRAPAGLKPRSPAQPGTIHAARGSLGSSVQRKQLLMQVPHKPLIQIHPIVLLSKTALLFKPLLLLPGRKKRTGRYRFRPHWIQTKHSFSFTFLTSKK